MAADEPERPKRPEYKVYRGGKGRKGGGTKPAGKPATPSRTPLRAKKENGPDYNVYRSRGGPLGKLRGAISLTALKERIGRGEGARSPKVSPKPPEQTGGPGEKPRWRTVLRWTLIVAGAWFLLSVVLFAISAQIQKGKLADAAAAELGGNPLLAAFPQTILVIGTDARPEATGALESEKRKKCLTQGATGEAPSNDCTGFRADTLMLVRAGGGSFSKLSIPRDTLAEVPGQGPQKINSAFASGGAGAQIEAVEDFLGIDIDHVVILDFQGFADFIDAIGGVKVNVTSRLKAKIDGGSSQGGITLKLDRGEVTLDGDRALAYSRARTNLRNPSETDLERTERQQQVLKGIKDRLTSPWRAPINFLRGPLIAWNAPKAMVSDMGALTLPQLAIAMAIGGDSGTKILGRRNSAGTTGGNIAVPLQECERAVRKFLGEEGPRTPACSPPG